MWLRREATVQHQLQSTSTLQTGKANNQQAELHVLQLPNDDDQLWAECQHPTANQGHPLEMRVMMMTCITRPFSSTRSRSTSLACEGVWKKRSAVLSVQGHASLMC